MRNGNERMRRLQYLRHRLERGRRETKAGRGAAADDARRQTRVEHAVAPRGQLVLVVLRARQQHLYTAGMGVDMYAGKEMQVDRQRQYTSRMWLVQSSWFLKK